MIILNVAVVGIISPTDSRFYLFLAVRKANGDTKMKIRYFCFLSFHIFPAVPTARRIAWLDHVSSPSMTLEFTRMLRNRVRLVEKDGGEQCGKPSKNVWADFQFCTFFVLSFSEVHMFPHSSAVRPRLLEMMRCWLFLCATFWPLQEFVHVHFTRAQFTVYTVRALHFPLRWKCQLNVKASECHTDSRWHSKWRLHDGKREHDDA